MQITPITCLQDNYAYIIHDETSKNVGVIDPSEAKPIINFLEKKAPIGPSMFFAFSPVPIASSTFPLTQ